MTETSAITQAAQILSARRIAGEQGPRLPESCRPTDLETALAIQAEVSRLLGPALADTSGTRMHTWKCGISPKSPVIMAPIYAATIHTASPCPAWVRDGKVKVEPELCFILGKDLPAREAAYTPEEVDAAIARTHLALELIDSRYSDPGAVEFVENLADGLLNQGLFIGPQVDDEQARIAAEMPIRVSSSTEPEIVLDGRHPNTHPRSPLYWLAEYLRSQGLGLQAGQAVITGSYAGCFTVPAQQDVTIQFGELGTLNVHFTPR